VKPPRRLEEHLGPGIGCQFREPGRALAAPARREALEAEPVRRQPGDGQRRGQGRRAGDGGDPDPGGDRRGDDPVARVADARHARVGDDQHVLARLQVLDQFSGTARLDHVVVGDHPAGDLDAQVRG